MYATVLFIALSGIAPSVKDEPVWMKDYGEAKKLCAKEEKPMAVVIGSGATGWNQLSRAGRLDKESRRLLANSYICLYLDTSSEEGQQLAQALEIEDSRGIVISSSNGKLQAFRHEGDLRNEDLAGYLRRFSDPGLVITHTETNPPAMQEYVAPVYRSSISIGRRC